MINDHLVTARKQGDQSSLIHLYMKWFWTKNQKLKTVFPCTSHLVSCIFQFLYFNFLTVYIIWNTIYDFNRQTVFEVFSLDTQLSRIKSVTYVLKFFVTHLLNSYPKSQQIGHKFCKDGIMQQWERVKNCG